MNNNIIVGLILGVVLSFLFQNYSLLLSNKIQNWWRPTTQVLDPLPPATPVSPMPKELTNLCHTLPQHLKTVWAPDSDYIFSEVLGELGWEVLDSAYNATFVWTTGHSDMPNQVLKRLRLGNGQIWNQLRDSWILCDKVKLHKILTRVKRTDYQPETYDLSDENECVEFFKSAKLHPETIWVTKVPAASQGDGITVNPPLDKLIDKWVDKTSNELKCVKNREEEYDSNAVLVQKYILDPLLLDGKKMEIRSYWVVASVDPLVLLYRDGTVRLTTREYTHGSWDDPLIHITNTKQQKKADPNYYKTEHERKWTLQQLAEYLLKHGKISNTENWIEEMRDKFKERIAVSTLAAYPNMLDDRKRDGVKRGWDGRYELFGMDIILDSNLNLWLTELQDGPGLSRDPGVKQHIIPTMIKELVDVLLEIDITLRVRKEKLSFPLKSLGGWHQIDVKKYLPLIPKDKVHPGWNLNN